MTGAGELGAWLADVAATSGRWLIGTFFAVLLGWPMGLFLGRYRVLWRIVEPVLELVRAVPPALVFPIALLLLGYGEWARVVTVAVGTCGLVVLHVASARDRAPCARRDVVGLAQLGPWARLRALDVPETSPAVFLSTRLALSQGLVIAIVGEMLVGTPHGLGARAMDALITYDLGRLFVVLALGGAIGMLASMGTAALERRVIPWAL